MQREFAEDLEELNDGRGSYLHPLRSLHLLYAYRHGDPVSYPGTNARQFLQTYNNFGIDYAEGHNGEVIAEGDARLGRSLLLSVRPEILLGEGDGVDLRLLEGKVALGLGPFEISAGRQALWWGQGRHGSLLLSDNAEPLDMVRLTNPLPAELPWLLRYLGPFRFDLFVSRLEEDRVVAEPYFSGLRINFKPAAWLELGAMRTLLFGGEGRSVDAGDFLTILTGRNLGGGADTSNQLAAVDARLRLPFLWGAELYGELGGEDEANHFFSKDAFLAGLYLPRLDPAGRFDLRLEYGDLAFQGNGPVWYRHSLYSSGYTYEERILGDFAGGDSRDWFGELRCILPGDATLALQLEYLRRGESQAVTEKHLRPGFTLDWELAGHTALQLAYAYDRISDFGFTAGDDRNQQYATVGVRREF